MLSRKNKKLPESKQNFDKALQQCGPQLAAAFVDNEQREKSLISKIEQFGEQVTKNTDLTRGLSAENSLRVILEEGKRKLVHRADVFKNEAVEHARLMRFRSQFGGRLIVYLLGPVNVGKTTFLRHFARGLSKVRFFLIDEDKTLQFVPEEKLEIRPTENTCQLQGAMTEDFVIIEAPGILSMTGKNQELARAYRDAADLLGWCTPANGGASISELKILTDRDIAAGRQRKRRLLGLALQASRVRKRRVEGQRASYEEMFSKEEQADVIRSIREAVARSEDLGPEFADSLTILPLSVCFAEQHEEDSQGYAQSGLAGVYNTLTELLQSGEALRIKTQLPQQRLQETVAYILTGNLENSLQALDKDLENLSGKLEQQRQSEIPILQAEVEVEVLDRLACEQVVRKLVEKCVERDGSGSLQADLTAAVHSRIREAVEPRLRRLAEDAEKGLAEATRESITGMPAYRATYKELSGGAAITGGAAVAGGVVGFGLGLLATALVTAIFPPAGVALAGPLMAKTSAAGALFGGVGGLAAGDKFVSSFRRKTNDNAEEMVASISKQLETDVPQMVKAGFDALTEQYHKPIQGELSRIRNFADKLRRSLSEESQA